ncbi:PsiA protein [Rahnella aquatilis]|nr:PsiA protein [Rahnella aquatilis]
MIPNSHALVPLQPQRRAAMQAIGYVESRSETAHRLGSYPYARAFFRFLGKPTIGLEEIRMVDGCFDPRSRRRPSKARYIAALDMLISTRGAACLSPLSGGVGHSLFPEVERRARQRGEQRASLKANRRRNVEVKAEEQKRRRYESLLGQAEIELAFCSPGTIRPWYDTWTRRDLRLYDLSELVYAWIARFPSLGHLDRYFLRYEPLWVVMLEVNRHADDQSEFEAYLDRLMLPNRLSDLENKHP